MTTRFLYHIPLLLVAIFVASCSSPFSTEQSAKIPNPPDFSEPSIQKTEINEHVLENKTKSGSVSESIQPSTESGSLNLDYPDSSIQGNGTLESPTLSVASILKKTSSSRLDSKLQTEYWTLLTEISLAHTGQIYQWKSADAKVLNKHKNLLSTLYQESLLPKIGEVIFGGKSYDITAAFITPGYSAADVYWNPPIDWKFPTSCGAVSAPGATYEGPCVFIRKIDGEVFVPENIGPFLDWGGKPALREVEEKYLLSESSDGDGCGGWGSYSLFDQNFSEVSSMKRLSIGCEDSELTLSKKGVFVKFGMVKFGNSEEFWVQHGSFSTLQIGKESNLPDTSIILETQYDSGSLYRFDAVKNLLNGSKFEFSVAGKPIISNPTEELPDISLSSTGNLSFIVKKTSEGFEIIAQSTPYIPLKSVRIHSCKENWDEYDDKWYTPKMIEQKSFTYRIHSKFGNRCKIPYIFESETERWVKAEQKLSIIE